MRTFLTFIMISLLSFGFIWTDAQAKRFGGGRSFGIQRPVSSFSNNAARQSTSGLMGKTNTNKWGGMLGGLFGGLLLGGLLTSLFMGNGLASGLLTWLILGAIIFFLISFFKSRKMAGLQSSMQGSGQYKPSNFNPYQSTAHEPSNQQSSGFSSMASNFMNKSADINEEDFLREAKVKFIRLQTAYDQKNIDDLREFTTPEVLAEIQMQYHEQDGAVNQTEVVSLNAELLNVEQEGNTKIASVRFTGEIKENSDKAEPLLEIWHFEQSGENGKWFVSGVQQVKPL